MAEQRENRKQHQLTDCEPCGGWADIFTSCRLSTLPISISVSVSISHFHFTFFWHDERCRQDASSQHRAINIQLRLVKSLPSIRVMRKQMLSNALAVGRSISKAADGKTAAVRKVIAPKSWRSPVALECASQAHLIPAN